MRRRLRTRTLALAVAGAAALALAACGGGGDAEPERAELRLTSPDFRAGGPLPRRLTCDGEGGLPALEWSGVPDEAGALALLVEDLDAPRRPVHRSVWGLAPETRALIGEGPMEGAASSGERGWDPPCPPRGDGAHRYRFTLHALREPLALEAGASPSAVRRALAEGTIATGTLEARYERR